MIALRYHARMAKLKSELEVTCPCCQATLLIDTNLGRVISHREPERGDKPELTMPRASSQSRRRGAKRCSSSRSRRRGAGATRSRKRFEEALKQAKTEPITKPTRDFDLD